MPLGRKTHLAQSITFTDLRIISFGLVTLLDELPNRRSRHRAGLPCHFAPGFEQCERGNGVDAHGAHSATVMDSSFPSPSRAGVRPKRFERRLCSSSISLTGSQRVIAFIFKLYPFDSNQIIVKGARAAPLNLANYLLILFSKSFGRHSAQIHDMLRYGSEAPGQMAHEM